MQQTIVITGASSGIGYAVASALCNDDSAASRRVVLLCRDALAGARVRDELTRPGRAEVALVVGSLSSARTITECAQRLDEACPRIDVLIHNAGVWPARRELNEDGLEQAFVVNHLAPFLLNRLLEAKLAQSRARVVQVSAGLYALGKPALERSPTGQDFSALTTYATTKLYNLMLMPLFAQRWRGLGITINAVHPGVIRTRLGDRAGVLGVLLKLAKRFWQEPLTAAPPIVRLALDPALAVVSARYFELELEKELSPIARQQAVAEALWQQAEQLTGLRAGSELPSLAHSVHAKGQAG